MGAIRYLSALVMLLYVTAAVAQGNKTTYSPCFLKDSVNTKLAFIRQGAGRIFTDSADCKDNLLDSIAVKYATTKEVRYLIALNAIRENHYAKADGLFTDVIRIIVQDDFLGFVDQLYMAKGKFLPLQNELIAAMNMIVNARPMKQKYMGQLNVEIDRAKNSADPNLTVYLEKLKQKIEGEQYR